MAKSNSAVQQRGGFGKFFRGVKAELKKVVWPTRKELINYTIVVFFGNNLYCLTHLCV